MQFDPHIHQRRSIRLKDYDYSQSGAYFVTLVTQNRLNLFGEITDGVMCLNHLGEIVHSAWLRLPGYFPITLDQWVLMPNHLHAILWIIESGRDEASALQDDLSPWPSLADASPQQTTSPQQIPPQPSLRYSSPKRSPIGTSSGSLGAIIQNFKSVTSRKIHQSFPTSDFRIWQRNYYEHIIRGQNELEQIRQYISDNPRRWFEDQENPEMSG